MFFLSVAQRVARITIDRGSHRNAVPIAQWAELEKAVRAANLSDAHLIVIASADNESFCAGSDLSELDRLKADPLMRKRFRGAMESAFDRIRACNKPTVALVRGGCFGTGVALATACDMRVTHPEASYAVTPARFGISYPPADMCSLVELVGRGQASRLVYGAEFIDGTEAYRIGLADVLDDAADVGAETIARIAANAPSSLCSLKATLLGRFGVKERFDASFASDDFSKGLSRYREKA